jgi:GGDEF domain-containing protein
MHDSTTPPAHGEMGSSTEDTFGWTEPEQASSSGGAGQQAREWLSQLQAMIENLATQAAPVVREVGAKAAELAAMAGEKAGPLAQRAAEFTEQAGHKLAERSRDFAEDLRRLVNDRIFDERHEGIHLTLSAGVAQLRQGEMASGLFTRASDALAAAKRGGRNRVELAK